MNTRVAWLAGVALALTLTVPPPAAAKTGPTRTRPQGKLSILSEDSSRRIDVNQINMWVTNFGTIAWDVTTGNPGLMFPKGTDKSAVFASGLWLGSKVGGEVRTEVAEYSQEYGPGIMTGGTFDDPTRPEYVVYKVARFTGDPQDTTHLTRSEDEFPFADPLVHHSWSEYMAGAAPFGAPWKTYRLPTAPGASDSVDVPGPDVIGDQMLWCVYNDADPSRHTNDAGGSLPLGLEIQQTTFAFNRQGALGNTVFLKYKLINKGASTLDEAFVSVWSDPDLGGFTDDLVGCDTTLSLGFVYNSTNNDQLYGGKPPALGYDFFRGPRDPITGRPLGLASFNKYINGTDPASTDETYNYMLGLLPDGSVLIDPTTGLPTRFFVPGDPVLGTGWLDTSPADRRFLLSSGPFHMAPGDTQEVVAGIVVGDGNDRLSSVSALKFYDGFAQAAFDSSFKLPSPPAQPKVEVAVDHGQAQLCWDTASRLNYQEPGYAFEGYNVYQGASRSGPWKRIATYDEVNGVRVVFDEVFDFNTGQTIPQFPTAFGSDNGISFCHTVTQDAIRGGPLVDDTQYYFAVTAYSYGADGKPKVLENAQQSIEVVPQRAASGTNLSTASAADVEYSQYDESKPPSTDAVVVQVAIPDSVTGHEYEVGFKNLVPPVFAQVGQDTATVTSAWYLYDMTVADTLLTGQLNRRGDLDYRLVDGLVVKEVGAYFPQLQTVNYLNNNDAHRRALTGVNWSGNQDWFFGGGGYANDFFGSSLDHTVVPDSFLTLEVRFSDTNTQKAYRYLRLEKQSDGGAPPQGRSYLYAGFWEVPFTVWDPVNAVQRDACFIERTITDDAGTILPDAQQPATRDSTWGPEASGDGGREYLFLMKSAYSDLPKPAYEVDAAAVDGSAPGLYALWAAKRDPSDVIDPGDEIVFTWAVPANPNDIYRFKTSKLRQNNTALATSRLDRIRVVPNPYYGRSTYELSQFSRVVRFVNLPEQCTIRIFNLAGDLVRTLNKTDASTSMMSWDVQTESRLPVASGVYLYHVDAKDAQGRSIGTTFGRLVVFMEKERLNNF